MKQFHDKELPLCFVDFKPQADVDCVLVNFKDAIRRNIDYLIEQGINVSASSVGKNPSVTVREIGSTLVKRR
ncbi:MAG: hypothetical protein LRY37_00850 [Alkalibacterium thalassium]|nr:hypothetical protein [Alkalibacterium thalassium]